MVRRPAQLAGAGDPDGAARRLLGSGLNRSAAAISAAVSASAALP
jgi:hypothetical protein